MQTPGHCLNCEENLHPDQAYCAVCGQKTAIHRLNFHELGHEAVHYFTHADKSIFSLMKQLALRPGVVAREYVEGKRQKYFKPLSFFLIVAGLLAFVSSSFYKPTGGRSESMMQYAQTINDPVKKQQMLDMAERTKKVAVVTGKYSNIINMLATPFFVLFLWLLYVRKKYNYTEHLFANMYFVGFTMIVYSLIILPLHQYILPQYGSVWIGIFFLFEIFYRGYAYTSFINDKTTGGIVKAYLISFLVSAIWFAGTTLFIMSYIKTGFR